MRKITTIIATLLINTCCHAYLSSYTSTITSVPENQSGFYYSDGQGNSISIGRTQNVPVYVNNYPNAIWVPMANGTIPPNAIVVEYINGYPSYYCKIEINGNLYYGRVITDQGCQIINTNEIFKSYFVLSR